MKPAPWYLGLSAALLLAGCPEKAVPVVDEDTPTTDEAAADDLGDTAAPGDDAPAAPDDAPAAPDDAPAPTDIVSPVDVPIAMDAGAPSDAPPSDAPTPPSDAPAPRSDTPTPPSDAPAPPVDVPLATDAPALDGGPAPFACRAPTAPVRVDPCPGRADCGLPSHGRVDVTGVRAALTDFQVRVVLPASVRAAVGAACDRLVFRTAAGVWAPHHVTDCAMGVVWVKVPALAAGATMLLMHYGGATAVAAADSYDATFDPVPRFAAGTLGAYTFDEGSGSRTCPTVGTVPFDAYIHQTPYDAPQVDVATRPALWSTQTPPSALDARARFTGAARSLDFPRHPVLPAAGVPSPNRLVNWRSASAAPFTSARTQLTVGAWVYAESPANAFADNFQTVVCFGMPDQPARMAVMPDARVKDNAIFNPWAIYFRSDNDNDTYFQGNSCVEPCTDVGQYAHITTRVPLTRAELTGRWHFMAITVDTTTRPFTTRRSYFDGSVFEFPRDLDLFPEDVFCPMGPGRCVRPPEAPIQYYPAPVVIGADLNDGEAQLGIEGKVDDLFILSRAIGPEEMAAYRERRQYSADPVAVAVTP